MLNSFCWKMFPTNKHSLKAIQKFILLQNGLHILKTTHKLVKKFSFSNLIEETGDSESVAHFCAPLRHTICTTYFSYSTNIEDEIKQRGMPYDLRENKMRKIKASVKQRGIEGK